MSPDPQTPSFKNNSLTGSEPPLLSASQPRGIGAPSPLGAGSPPPLPAKPTDQASPVRQLLATLLSLCLGLFLADAVISLVDDSLILFLGIQLLAAIRGFVFLFAMLLALVIYGLMGLTPMIPKRQFLPITLFNFAAQLAVIPCLIYFFGRIQQVIWVISLSQVIFGLSILYWVQGGLKFRWPLVAVNQLAPRRFSWLNLSVFLLGNVVLLGPAVIVYLAFCARLAVDHLSDGFVALRRDGLTVQVRKYVRNDGKTIQLVPMAHIGEPAFYRELAQSFPTNATVLMEGVTDNRNLLTNKITYQRMATSLGVAEQQKEFRPQGELVRADVDIEQFAKTTIDLLNLAMRIHAQGVNAETVLNLLQYSPPPHFQAQLFDDLLNKRNRHVVDVIRARLSQSENIIVPWGAAHMPGIAKEIQQTGFRLDETREYVAIRFRGRANQSKGAGQGGDHEKARTLP